VEIFVVNAYKFGDRENHSYTVGVFDDYEKSKECAESHTTYRGGKYGCVVEKTILNSFTNDMLYYTEEVYWTESVFCDKSKIRDKKLNNILKQ
jgi:hypothetical protein